MILNINQLIIPFLEYMSDYYNSGIISYYKDNIKNCYYIIVSDNIYNDDTFTLHKLKLISDIFRIFRIPTVYFYPISKKNFNTSLFEIEYHYEIY